MSVGLLSTPSVAGAPPGQFIVVSDLNSGLYVLEAPWSRTHATPASRARATK